MVKNNQLENRRSKYEMALFHVAQSLVLVAIVAGVGSGISSRVNTASIDSLKTAVTTMQKSQRELAKTQHDTALINEKQTQQLIYLSNALHEFRLDLRELKERE
jgi:hypothetical protein